GVVVRRVLVHADVGRLVPVLQRQRMALVRPGLLHPSRGESSRRGLVQASTRIVARGCRVAARGSLVAHIVDWHYLCASLITSALSPNSRSASDQNRAKPLSCCAKVSPAMNKP